MIPQPGDYVQFRMNLHESHEAITVKVLYTTSRYFFFNYNNKKLMKLIEIIQKVYTPETHPEMFL